MKRYGNKPILFNLKDPGETALWHWLETLPRGRYAKETRDYWKRRMQEEMGDQPFSPSSGQVHAEMAAGVADPPQGMDKHKVPRGKCRYLGCGEQEYMNNLCKEHAALILGRF